MGKRTIRDIDAAGKRVLVRVDFNVPVSDGTGEITDDSRIRASLPTIRELLEQGAAVILCSHFGRPRGRVVESLRLGPVRTRLEELLRMEIIDAGGPTGEEPARVAASLRPGRVALLENVRFDSREEANDPGMARELADLADLYVNDAFGAAHRAHASTAGVAAYLPAVAGLLMARELEMLGMILTSPRHPLVAVIGGAKVSDKIAVLRHLSRTVDVILVGGGMTAAFLRAKGFGCGAAEVTDGEIAAARHLLDSPGPLLMTPTDVVVADRFAADAPAQTVGAEGVPDGKLILDIGPRTREAYGREIGRALTIVWNGPVGVQEWQRFAQGTHAVARAIAANSKAVSVVGGGSTVEVVGSLGLRDRMTHVSTGGGASLEFLEGKVLPGVAALQDV
ncbi:MAG: phosphoglycerate kinase [Gemmatimonadetes bacterium]|nr:phosphoglycerate kinase [Gemmatimonadota bacterium]